MKRKTLLMFLYCLVGMLVLPIKPTMAQIRPTISILGDSYSTFEDFIPKENASWYLKKPLYDRTDVTKVEQTWWWQVIKEGGYKLGINNSYSGATICNTGYDDKDYTDRSFVTRALNLGNPDIILICGGTNDHWAEVKMGDYQYKDWKRADLFFFRPAMAKMLNDIRQHYPNVEVFFILNTELKSDINKSVAEICQHYGVGLIQLHDIEKKNGHPDIKGMREFANQVLYKLKNKKT